MPRLSKKNSRFLSFITVLSVAGVAIGVTAMIVVLSVMDGFEGELKKRLMSTDLHVLIEPTPQVREALADIVPARLAHALPPFRSVPTQRRDRTSPSRPPLAIGAGP